MCVCVCVHACVCVCTCVCACTCARVRGGVGEQQLLHIPLALGIIVTSAVAAGVL